jgi:hypothetical protein
MSTVTGGESPSPLQSDEFGSSPRDCNTTVTVGYFKPPFIALHKLGCRNQGTDCATGVNVVTANGWYEELTKLQRSIAA